MTFRRIAIVNRGEAAMRLIHAVRDLNAETAVEPIETVALHTEGERRGDVRARGRPRLRPRARPRPAPTSTTRSWSGPCVETGADAAWVGWGFVAEDPAFAELCERIGVTFIGPSAEAMRRLGDKIGSKLIAEEVGVPVAPWSRRRASTPSRTRIAAADEIGYPLMLKATAGGGGRGIRKIASDDGAGATPTSAPATRRSARSAAAWSSSRAWSPARGTSRSRSSPTARARRGRSASATARSSAATRRSSRSRPRRCSSAEQTARAQGQSAERLALAVGLRRRRHRRVPLPPGRAVLRLPRGQHPAAGRAPDHRGHHRHRPGQGCRSTSPSGGRLEGDAAGRARPRRRGPAQRRGPRPRLRPRRRAGSPCSTLPAGPGHPGRHRRRRGRHDPRRLRLDDRQDHRLRPQPRRGAGPAAPRGRRDHRGHRGRRDQQELHPRPARPARGHRRLAPTPAGSTGSAARDGSSSHQHSGIALVAAGIEAYEDEEQVEVTRLLETARGGRPQVQHKVGRAVDLKLRGAVHKVTRHAHRAAPVPGRRRRRTDADRRRRRSSGIDAYASRLTVERPRYRLVTATPRPGPPRRGRRRRPTGSAATRAASCVRPRPPWSSRRRSAAGAEVAAGAPVLVLESMKMETVLPAPFAATVQGAARLHGQPGRDRRAAASGSSRSAEDDERGRRTGGDEPAADLELPSGRVVAHRRRARPSTS